MNLLKAIRRLHQIRDLKKSVALPTSQSAIQIGIEAIGQTIMLRRSGRLPPGAKLPSETKD